jgi:predicted Rossmann-fold nucleotide-binding protein
VAQVSAQIKFMKNRHLLGQTLAKQNIQLIYGGSETGLMGTIANGVLSENGKVTGVLPIFYKLKKLLIKALPNWFS